MAEKNSVQGMALYDFFEAADQLPTVNPNARVHDVAQRLTDMVQVQVTPEMVETGALILKIRVEKGHLALSSLPKAYAAVKKALKAGAYAQD